MALGKQEQFLIGKRLQFARQASFVLAKRAAVDDLQYGSNFGHLRRIRSRLSKALAKFAIRCGIEQCGIERRRTERKCRHLSLHRPMCHPVHAAAKASTFGGAERLVSSVTLTSTQSTRRRSVCCSNSTSVLPSESTENGSVATSVKDTHPSSPPEKNPRPSAALAMAFTGPLCACRASIYRPCLSSLTLPSTRPATTAFPSHK